VNAVASVVCLIQAFTNHSKKNVMPVGKFDWQTEIRMFNWRGRGRKVGQFGMVASAEKSLQMCRVHGPMANQSSVWKSVFKA